MDTSQLEAAVDDLVAEIKAAGSTRAPWPVSQTSDRHAVDFNSDVLGAPYLAGSGYLADLDAAVAFAGSVLPQLRALEDEARSSDDRGIRAYATVVSERRDPAWGESGDPVYERDYDPDLPAAPDPTADRDRTLKETIRMTATDTTTASDAGLGTAGRGSISGLVVDWESSVEARQHPETFIAWLQAQAAAARQRAQMVPELVASYHGRGPSGHAGVPDTQIAAFTQRYEEAALAEAEAYGRWAIEYASYVEEAQQEMTATYGREVIGSAHAAHQG